MNRPLVLSGLAAVGLLAVGCGSSSPSATTPPAPASYRGEVLSVRASGAVPIGVVATVPQMLAATPVLVRWRITNVGGSPGTPSHCAIGIRVPRVAGFGLSLIRVGQLKPGESRSGGSTIPPVGAFPPGLWAAQVKASDIVVACKAERVSGWGPSVGLGWNVNLPDFARHAHGACTALPGLLHW